MSRVSDLSDLRARIDAERGPGIARCESSARDESKRRAASAMRRAMERLGCGTRELARTIGCDKKQVELYLGCVQQPSWMPFRLPRAAYLEFCEAMLDMAPPDSRKVI